MKMGSGSVSLICTHEHTVLTQSPLWNPTFIECYLLSSGLSFTDTREVADAFEKLTPFND